jgi:hypothetical protein
MQVSRFIGPDGLVEFEADAVLSDPMRRRPQQVSDDNGASEMGIQGR